MMDDGDEAGEPPNNRQRIYPPPPDAFQPPQTFNVSTQNTASLIPRYSSVAIQNTLFPQNNNVRIMPMADVDAARGPRFRKAAVFMIVMVKMAIKDNNNKKPIYAHQRGAANNAHGTPVSYDTAIYVKDALSTTTTMSVIFTGAGNNPYFWSNDYGARHQLCTPGSFFVLQGPEIIGHMGAETDGRYQPIIISSAPAKFIQSIRVPPQSYVDNSLRNMNAMVYEGCTVVITDMRVQETGCSGDQCDQQGLAKEDGTISKYCSCTTMMNLTNLMIDFSLEITLPSGDKINVGHFSSRSATNTYIVKTRIRSGTSKRRVLDHEEQLFVCAEEVMNYLNANGGVTIGVWLKRGRTLDRSVQVEETNSGYRQSQPPQYVVSSEAKYHLFSLRPTNLTQVNWETIYDMKFDTSLFDL